MLFVEFRFFEFFLVVFAVYWTLRKNEARLTWLLATSYVFYAAFFVGADVFTGKLQSAHWWFPLMLAASTLMDFVVGLRIESARTEVSRRVWVFASVCANIGVLVYFKYAGFLVQSAGAFAEWIGLPASRHTLSIFLPVGVSFYTFQSLSYTIEVYRRHRPAERNLLKLATFIAFFPQLVAGPIVRANAFLPQLESKRRWSDVDVRGALVLFMTGFVKKRCVSDLVAPFVDPYFAQPESYGHLSALTAILLYAVQIYCDFSGYTDMAIAAARLLGYELTINFNFPYFARDIGDFWRRWHISLSTWLRDYLYISLGGNRGSKLFTCRNLMLTMILGGLWHGSRWTFAIWGALHGVALVAQREWAAWPRVASRLRSAMYPALSTVLTFSFVCVCWVFFRAADLSAPMSGDDFRRAIHILGSALFLVPDVAAGSSELSPRLLLLFAGLAAIHWLNYRRVFSTWWRKCSGLAFALSYGCLAELILLFVPVKYAPFIYFQF